MIGVHIYRVMSPAADFDTDGDVDLLVYLSIESKFVLPK